MKADYAGELQGYFWLVAACAVVVVAVATYFAMVAVRALVKARGSKAMAAWILVCVVVNLLLFPFTFIVMGQIGAGLAVSAMESIRIHSGFFGGIAVMFGAILSVVVGAVAISATLIVTILWPIHAIRRRIGA